MRRSATAMVGCTIVVFWIGAAVLGPEVAPYDPNAPAILPLKEGAQPTQLPMGAFMSVTPYRSHGKVQLGYYQVNAPPNSHVWLGTDDQGRDILSRLLVGARQVMTIAPLSVLLGAFVGVLLGLTAGYYGGWADEVLMRILDTIIAFPIILIILLIVSSVGASRVSVAAAIAFAAVPSVSRLARSMTLDLRTRDYVVAARLRGERTPYILVREILPNASGPILIDMTLRIGYAVFAMATLGFLGLGLPPPTPDWGTMVADARNFATTDPSAAAFPAAAIASLVVGLNLMADGIREQRGR